MHGIGNDYIYVNCFEQQVANPQDLAKRLSDRHFGIGADGLVLILPSETSDLQMRMFNADGSEAKMCGNAVRCIAKYAYERGLRKKTTLSLETQSGEKTLYLEINDGCVERVRVDLGEPAFAVSAIPVLSRLEEIINEPIPSDAPFPAVISALKTTCVSVGNPHAVLFVPDIPDKLVNELGPVIENHPMFPDRTNVEFVKVIGREEIRMRVWERGSGETLACGTGAAAAVAAGIRNGLLDRKVLVHLLGGDLFIEWAQDNHIYKSGPAAFVFDGVVEV